MKVQKEIPIKKAVCFAGKTAKNNNQRNKRYHNNLFPSRIKRNISHQVQRHQHHHGWFSDLLILTSEQARVKGHPKIATYYRQLAEKSVANPRGGIVR